MHWTAAEVDSFVLENIAAHLRSLADELSGVGNTMSVVLRAEMIAHVSPHNVQQLQKIDYLHQALQDLASLNEALATTGDDRLAALENLKMTATSELLDAGPSDLQPSSGCIEWF